MLRTSQLNHILELLKNSTEDVFDFIFREAKDGFWVQKANSPEAIYFSPQILDILGYTGSTHLPPISTIIDQRELQEVNSNQEQSNHQRWNRITLYQANGESIVFEAMHRSFVDRVGDPFDLICLRKPSQSPVTNGGFPKKNIWKILDLLPATIGFWDHQLINVFANEAYSSWFGKKPTDIFGKHISEVLNAETYLLNLPYLEKVLKGEPQSFERELPKADGSGVRTSLAHYIPSFDEKGNVEGFVALVSDISSVKEEQRKAEQSEAELRVLLRSLPVGVSILDENMNLIELNPKLEEILNLSIDSIKKGDYKKYKFVNTDLREYRREELPSIRCVSEKKIISDIVMGLSEDNKVIKWLNVTAVPLSIPGFSALTITNDITELRSHELLSERLFSIVNSSADAIYGTNAEGKIITWNKGAEILFGYTKEEIVGQRAEILIPKEMLAEEILSINRCLKGESIVQNETNRQGKDGKLLDVSMSMSPIYNSHGHIDGISVVARDIHEQKFIQEEQKRAKVLAEQASMAKSDFLANMSHEIRTPLNGIIGFTDLLLKTTLDHTQKDYMRTIYQSANSLLDIVSDILDFSKIEAGKLDLVPERTSLGDLADEVINIVRYQANQKQVKLRLNIDPELPDFVMIDPTRLRQIIINLLSNAIKFTDRGKIEFSISILEKIEDDLMKIRISIQDTGIGIAKENQSKIFEAFTQEDFSTTRRFGGTGLGLSISNKILGLMNSKIQLTSESGKGSDFFFDLDLRTSSSSLLDFRPDISGSEKVLKKPIVIENHYSILVAEDNNINMMLVKAILKKILPYSNIEEARNGNEAIVRVQDKLPDMIFMDIQMPVINGYEAAGKIRLIPGAENIPIIAVTAGTVLGERERCLEAGMNDYISKPAIRADFERMIHLWLAKT